MFALTSAQRLVLGIGMLAFLTTCLYLPWKMQVWESRPVGSVDFTWRPIEPPFTQYRFVFSHPDLTMPGGSTMVVELNIQLLLTEWLGVCLLTAGFIWLVKRGR